MIPLDPRQQGSCGGAGTAATVSQSESRRRRLSVDGGDVLPGLADLPARHLAMARQLATERLAPRRARRCPSQTTPAPALTGDQMASQIYCVNLNLICRYRGSRFDRSNTFLRIFSPTSPSVPVTMRLLGQNRKKMRSPRWRRARLFHRGPPVQPPGPFGAVFVAPGRESRPPPSRRRRRSRMDPRRVPVFRSGPGRRPRRRLSAASIHRFSGRFVARMKKKGTC